MESKGFSIGTLLKRGWRLMKQHLGLFLVFEVVMIVFGVIPALVAGIYPDLQMGWTVLIGIVSFLFVVVIHIGLFRLSLNSIDDVPLSMKDLFSGFTILIQWIVASIIFVLIVGIPVALGAGIAALLAHTEVVILGALGVFVVILTYILSIYLATRFWLWPFVMIDKTTNPITALQKSSLIGHGAKWDILLCVFATWLVMYLGFVVFGVGVFVALPIAMITQAGMYRVLESQTKSE